MSISSEHPVSADQIYRALVALGAEPLFDPEVRPEGPQDEDRRRLLGVLLAKAELEITAATRLGSDEDEGEVLLGWIEEAGPDSGLTDNVLVNRLHRTGVQLLGLDEDETFPGQSAASMAIVVAPDTFGAHLRFQDGDVDGVRRALGRAQVSIIEVLNSIHDLRVAIGDAEEEEEEE
ncbi:hypothetical protein AQI95_42760 [Streptomyces yokosukanensis]|uniref:Uncharacterized protein n=1 Tax=Streptomyces yokosukanensis TaxID=67386 RepID=A0A101NMY1_9ACTN|nr:hypothetical protein [Streptomyces yokosukanensis]KUM96019.1 hypothetical protein AQI95_42760 [Streptomyces yokosukanensis]